MARLIALRVVVALVVGILISGVVTEAAFRLQRENVSRPPKIIELVIPPGTAEKISKGEAGPSLPQGMLFVVGDVLQVRNEDNITHTLGPLVIPPGSAAGLKIDSNKNLSYSCSFQPTNYLGLDVTQPLTISTRVQGILLAGIPLGVLFALYSLVAWPLKK
jgi:hypothetical protein